MSCKSGRAIEEVAQVSYFYAKISKIFKGILNLAQKKIKLYYY